MVLQFFPQVENDLDDVVFCIPISDSQSLPAIQPEDRMPLSNLSPELDVREVEFCSI